jgi:alpha-L-fucosidase
MPNRPVSRRSFVKQLGAAGALACSAPALRAQTAPNAAAQAPSAEVQAERVTRAQRLRWWLEAKFGMFIHWGLYSVIGQQEWVMESEGIPIPQYEILAEHFKPAPDAARTWAKLAKRAGQKYMVMTTKHHEGFCMFDTKLTDFNAMQQGPKRDLVKVFVDAARAEGLRVGFYYSLMDWHHPDGARCATDEAARARFVAYTHGLIRELMTNYGKIDILWYDVDWPLTLEQWEADRMNEMVFHLQPEIIVNNRNGLEGDFSTPEQRIQAAESGRAWESCMTMNDGWGYQQSDQDWKSARTIINNLTTCAQDGGNYLLNIGPMADGTVPDGSVRVLDSVGRWLETNGAAIYGADGGASASTGNYDNFTRKGNTLYVHVYFWPGHTPAAEWLTFCRPESVVAIGGVQAKVKSARVLKTGQSLQFTQDAISVRIVGLPLVAPDDPVSVIALECEAPPAVDHHSIRPLWPRYGVGISRV